MQVLSVPLRAFLFCFEFVFGEVLRIKSSLTLMAYDESVGKPLRFYKIV